MEKKKSKAVKWYKRPIMKLEQRESDDVEIVASLDSIISFFQYMNSRMEENQKVLRLMDFQREDVYHEIELGASRNASEGYRMYKLLREISESRRVIKQESARIEPICLFLKQNPSFLEALKSSKMLAKRGRQPWKPRPTPTEPPSSPIHLVRPLLRKQTRRTL